MEKAILSPREAEPMVGMNRASLEAWIRSGKCPFGVYVKKDGREKGHFYIYRARLNAYITASDMRPICPYARDYIKE
jgi:hypothetical protein